MTSSRLPGKVLRRAQGRPLLDFLFARLEKASGGLERVVSTSSDLTDQSIVDYCQGRSISCFRGPLLNVAQRFGEMLREFPTDAFVRVSGDSPLLDWRLVNEAIKRFTNGERDIVTNVQARTFPKGQSVEVIRSSIFLDALPKLIDPSDQEHVTPYFYRHASNYLLENFQSNEKGMENIQLAVDTPTDWEWFEFWLKEHSDEVARVTWRELALHRKKWDQMRNK